MSTRAQRVAERVREEIAQLMQKGLKDPRIGFASVMGVEMSSDLRYAKVFVSVYGTEAEKKATLAGLRSASGFVRREVAGKLQLRHAPEIRFLRDESLDRVFHLQDVLQEIRENEEPLADDENGDDNGEG